MFKIVKGLVFSLALFICASQAWAGKVLVLNATSGIGQAVVSKLRKDGKELILTARNLDKLKNAQNDTDQSLFLDFSTTQHGALSEYLQKHSPQLDGLVVITPTLEMSADIFPAPNEWEKSVKEGFISPLEAIKIAHPYLRDNAKIVILGGLVGVNVLDFRPHSAVLRLMWVAKAKELSRQLASRGIHVNTVSPGGTLTDKFKKGILARAERNNRSYDDQLALEVKDIPMQRYNDPSNVADCICFLLSENSNFVTGSNLVVDGGYHRNY